MPDLPINVPTVMLNGTSARFPVSVLPDEYRRGQRAVEMLRAAGIADGIVLLRHNAEEEAGLLRSETIARRFAGIRGAMDAAGMTFSAELSCWNWEPGHGYELMRKLLKSMRPLALLCLNDRLAFGAYQALAEAGMRVPEDIAVVSFDNDELASYLRPGLATIGLPHEEMGRLAVELLLGHAEAPVMVEMPVIERGSLPRP